MKTLVIVGTYVLFLIFIANANPTEEKLLDASQNGNEGLVKTILEKSETDVNFQKNGETALILAAKNGNEEIVKLLLVHPKINLDLKDNGGNAALHWAARNGHEKIVQLILQNSLLGFNAGSKFDKNCRIEFCGYGRINYQPTPLILASMNGHEKVVKVLLKNSYNVNKRDRNGKTSLIWAASNGHEKVVAALLESNEIDVNMQDARVDGYSALMIAAQKGYEKIVWDLLELPQTLVNEKGGKEEFTPLMTAAFHGQEKIVQILLKSHGIDVNANSYGRTALSLAAREGKEKVVRILLKIPSIDVNIGQEENSKLPNGFNALQYASISGHQGVVKALLENSATNVNKKDLTGRSALMSVVEYGWAKYEIVKILLQAPQININVIYPDTGETVMEMAEKNGLTKIIELLQEHSIKQAKLRAMQKKQFNDNIVTFLLTLEQIGALLHTAQF